MHSSPFVAPPAAGHPAAGVIRAIVKDQSDVYQGSQSETWLDSDGWVASNEPRNMSEVINTEDNAWHHVVLSTLNGTAGFAIYVDGGLAAIWGPGQNGTTEQVTGNDFVQPDGGNAPLLPPGELVLCQRSDLTASRQFQGRIAQVALYNESLSPGQVEALYESVAGAHPQLPPPQTLGQLPPGQSSAAAAAAPPKPSVNRTAVDGTPCLSPFPWNGRQVFGCITIPPGVEMCMVAANTWERCAPIEASATDQQAADIQEFNATTATTSSSTKGVAAGNQTAAAAAPADPAPVASVAPPPTPSSKGGLSGGAIAGIVIGSVAGAVILASLAALGVQRMRRRRPGAFQPYQDRGINGAPPPAGGPMDDRDIWSADLPPIQIRSRGSLGTGVRTISLPPSNLTNVAPSSGGIPARYGEISVQRPGANGHSGLSSDQEAPV